MRSYRIAVNMEWTSKCNARCVMCPREVIHQYAQTMKLPVFEQTLRRITPGNTYRVAVAGYGEPTTHPLFLQFVDRLKAHPVRFDIVSNGQMLDEERFRALDGIIHTLIISFSSIDPDVYRQVQAGLNHEQVKANIVMAQKMFKKTRLAISLTPMLSCLATLPTTIKWLRGNGVERLTMSPTFYDRAGNLDVAGPEYTELRRIIKAYGLHSQELDFVGSIRDFAGQWLANRYKCIPRNADMPIAADGCYQYCFNDVGHGHPLGHVADMSIREALELREKSQPDARICDACSMRQRYRVTELLQVARAYLFEREKNMVRPG